MATPWQRRSPGHIYHLTHRCQDRQFLLRFLKDRDNYRRRLRKAALEVGISVLTYHITSNHGQVVAYAEEPEAFATLMQHAAGEMARDYNRRKGRSGAFWEGPPWASGHLWKRSRLRSNPASKC